MEQVTETTWPNIRYPADMFSPEATDLLQRLLYENAYMRADYYVCLKSRFMVKNNQGYEFSPIVRGPYNALIFK